MALVACSECGKMISDRAPACPHCGAPAAVAAPAATPARSSAAEPEERQVKCLQCGAGLTAIGFACEYCGTIVASRIRTFDPADAWVRQREVIQNNLDALHALPRPSAKQAVVTVVWWYVTILSLGIVAIFWRRSKKPQFQREQFNKITGIVQRNIDGIRRLSAGDSSLEQQLDPLVTEFDQLRGEFAAAAKTRTRAIVLIACVLGGIMVLGQFSSSGERKRDHEPAVTGAPRTGSELDHQLFHAAAASRDPALIAAINRQVGIVDPSGAPNDRMVAFMNSHATWVWQNTRWIADNATDPAKAKAWLKAHTD
jgi:DNA-directed RNA polymerase subunit RPC12/RpoP